MNHKFKARLADILALLLSLILALAIWFNAQQAEDPLIRRVLQIPVDFIGIPENVKIIEPDNLNTTVLVAYEGPTSVVDLLGADDFSAEVDLSQISVGQEQTVPINVRVNNDEVTVNLPAPSEIAVHLEELVTKQIPVELELRGSIARGYIAEDPLIEPEFITVKGTASDVDKLALARITVFLGNEDVQTKIASPQPIFYDQQGRVAGVSNLELSHNQVDVTLPIREAADFANRVISVNIIGEPAPGYRVLNTSVNPPSVLVTGRPSQLELPFRVQTEPIDVTGLTESFQTRVSLTLPEGVTLDEVQEIVATVEIEPFSSTKIFNRPVEILGVAEGLTATADPETVRVVLFGPLPVLDALPEQEISVTADLFGLGVGKHMVEPDVLYPDRGLEKRSIQPALVTIIITDAITNSNGLTESLGLTNPVVEVSGSTAVPFWAFRLAVSTAVLPPKYEQTRLHSRSVVLL